MLEKLSKLTGKSAKMLLFEVQQSEHPRVFKRWLKEEQQRKTGKLVTFVCGAPDITPIIELVDGNLVETKFPEELAVFLMEEY